MAPRVRLWALPLLAAGVLVAACGEPAWDVEELVGDDRLGGDATVTAITSNAFGLPNPGLKRDDRRRFELGDSFFTQPWVEAPASTTARDGLGPQFNANSCAGCHVRDGRGQPPTDQDDSPGLLMRLSVPGVGDHGGPVPHPVYGGQLQDHALPALTAEGSIVIRRTLQRGTYTDGTPFQLERPSYDIVEWRDGRPRGRLLVSPRVAPQLIGVGLLEAIPAEDIRAAADPDDADGDGISGRINEVWSPTLGRKALGRIGWKANVATVADQVAGAFNGDIGITSPVQPEEEDCEFSPLVCEGVHRDGEPEIDRERLGNVVFYSQTLAVPAMREPREPQVTAGAETFVGLGCAECHTPVQQTGDDHAVRVLRNQTIRPYTDLLLHDMGPQLADGRPDFAASGSEWRTPPLWGVGLVESINGHTRFLHDGRARNLEEAILWHGGEGEAARERFRALDADKREALLAFLRSL
jgi:CxxC motif-containing protein (DUF1111 family)